MNTGSHLHVLVAVLATALVASRAASAQETFVVQVAVGGATDGESHPEELWECWIADAAARVGDAAAGLILVDSLLFYYDDTDSTYTRVPLSILLQRAGVTAMNLRDRLEYTGQQMKLGRWTSERIVTRVATFDLDVPDSLPTVVTIWATGDPDLPVRGVAALMTLLTALSAPELVVVYDDLASQGLRPIQVDLVREFGVLELTTTFRLLDLERRKPPRSLFAVPPAYTERKLPR